MRLVGWCGDVGAASILGDPGRGAEVTAARMADTAPTRPAFPLPMLSGETQMSTAGIARSGAGRTAPPRAAIRWDEHGGGRLPRHDVGVRGHQTGRMTNPVRPGSGRTPALHSHDGSEPGRRRPGTACSGVPTSAGPSSGLNTSGYGATQPSGPARATTWAVRRPARSSKRSRALRRGPTRRARQRGKDQPEEDDDAARADGGAGNAVAALDRVHAGQSRMQQRAGGQAQGLAEQPEAEDERQHRDEATARRRRGERGHEVRDEADRDHERAREPGPGQGPRDESEAVTADRGMTMANVRGRRVPLLRRFIDRRSSRVAAGKRV